MGGRQFRLGLGSGRGAAASWCGDGAQFLSNAMNTPPEPSGLSQQPHVRRQKGASSISSLAVKLKSSLNLRCKADVVPAGCAGSSKKSDGRRCISARQLSLALDRCTTKCAVRPAHRENNRDCQSRIGGRGIQRTRNAKETKLYKENEIWCKRCRARHRATGPSKGRGAKGAQNIASGAAAQSASLAVRSGSPKRLMVATCDGEG